MERIRYFEHQGVRLLLADLSGLEETEALRRELQRAHEIVRREPPESLRVLVNLTGIPYTLGSVAVLREYALRNRPYVRARAVVGLPEVARLSFRAVAHVSGRKMETFDDVATASDWLVGQL